MKHTWLFKSSRVLVGLWVLALLAVSPSTVQADEIWVSPTPAGKKPLGNWPGSPLKKSSSFAWHIPDDAVGSTDSAKIVVISLKDGDISYQINTSLAVNGDALFADPPETVESTTGDVPLVLTMTAGELTEINVPLPTLIAGDYFSVNFLKKSKAKLVVVGLRYTYNADWTRNGSSLYYTLGNVGLGTSSPLQKLDVRGNTYVSGNTGLGTTAPLQKLDVRGSGYISSRLGIGDSTPLSTLEVRHGFGVGSNGLTITGSGSDTSALYTASTADLWFVMNGTVKGVIDGSTGVYSVFSDRRLKKNIEPLGNTLDKVMALKPSKYHFKTEGNSGSKHFGLIAQELKEVFPEAVSVQSGGENGGLKDLHIVAYSKLIPVLIKGMQEQQTIIQGMQEKLDSQQKQQVAYQALEGMVQKMQMKLDRLEKADWTLAGNK